MFYVSSGGIIRYYSPLYKSEGTAQVSIHTIKYLELYIKEYENIDDAFLFYDNMVKIIIYCGIIRKTPLCVRTAQKGYSDFKPR